MTEERVTYTLHTSTPSVQAVRLENFANPDWQGFLNQRLFQRYPGALITERRPCVVVVVLRTPAWGEEDKAFFTTMRQEGFFQRWEALQTVPPRPRHSRAVFEDIGYRVGEGEPLTTAQQRALLTLLHEMEERATHAEQMAAIWKNRAETAEAFASDTSERHNAMVDLLHNELQIEAYLQEEWVAEDKESGQILLRDADLLALYRKTLRLRLGGKERH